LRALLLRLGLLGQEDGGRRREAKRG